MLSISKAENNTYIVKDETGKEVFKADDENALAGYILAKGAEKESQVKTPEKIFSEKAPVKNQTLPPFEAARPAGAGDGHEAFPDVYSRHRRMRGADGGHPETGRELPRGRAPHRRRGIRGLRHERGRKGPYPYVERGAVRRQRRRRGRRCSGRACHREPRRRSVGRARLYARTQRRRR